MPTKPAKVFRSMAEFDAAFFANVPNLRREPTEPMRDDEDSGTGLTKRFLEALSSRRKKKR